MASLETVGSRKRNYVDSIGSLDNNNNVDNTALAVTFSPSQPVARSISHSTAQFISSSSSISCEESCSSSSNDTAQTYSDLASESHTVSFVVTTCHRGTRKSDQERKHNNRNYDLPCSLSNAYRRNIEGIDQIKTEPEPHQSNLWDDLNWTKKGDDTAGTSSATTTTTIHTSMPMACSRSKHSKVQGIMFATSKPLHSEKMVWEDTHWQLTTFSSTTKKRKTTRMLTMSTENDTTVAHPKSPSRVGTSCYDIDDATASNKRVKRLKKRLEQNLVPTKNGSVKRRLYKRFNEPDNTEQNNHISLWPIMPTLNTGITYLLKNQHLGGHRSSSIGSPYTLYRWLRVRLAAGIVRSSFDFLHRMLKKYYDEMAEVVKNIEKDKAHTETLALLVSLRDRLAGIWCVYAHFTLEVGCLVFARARKRERSSWKKTSSQKNILDNRRCEKNEEKIFTMEIGVENEIGPCSSKNSNNTSNFKDDQKTSTVLKNKSVPIPTFGILVEKSFINATLCNGLPTNRVEKHPSPTQTALKGLMKHVSLKERDKEISKMQDDLSFHDFSNLAISILLVARDCPLVGNHIAIGASLGRLIVSSTVMEESKTDCTRVELSRETLLTNIKSAIDVCWDSIDVCRGNRRTNRRYAIRPISMTAIRSLSNFQLKCGKSNWEKEDGTQVQEGIKSTLLLPTTLRNALSSTLFSNEGMVVSDKDTTRCLCKEVNRWSRLRERLEVNSQHTIRITPSCDSEVSFAAEELPLYASLESLSDPLNRYKDVVTPGKGIIWQW